MFPQSQVERVLVSLKSENLKKVLIDQEIDLCRLRNNYQARRLQTRANREKNKMILNKQKDFLENRLPLPEFLKSFSRFYETDLYNSDMIDEDIIQQNDNYEISTEFLSESYDSNSNENICGTQRISIDNVNVNSVEDSFTLNQRQDDKRLSSLTLRHTYIDTEEGAAISENATDLDIINMNSTDLTSLTPANILEEAQNTHNTRNLSQLVNLRTKRFITFLKMTLNTGTQIRTMLNMMSRITNSNAFL
ncbi:uncharacterized protein LOC116848379 isoform X2 [Odontomachus brunneus]|uniref:uncharacterized protein LOC116848379 isoform X2 n=1 Tax=Odontomachus brunneus TaxID=486640 RepID=UPI0013F29246|nr:uncharacterized protein LOC116848379 isoform X2 [Odontomachus brunneus]